MSTYLVNTILLGVCLMVASLLTHGNELIFAGRSAQEAFKSEGVVKLLKAVSKHDANEAKRLINGGVNINTLGKDGTTPLIWMLGQQDLKAVELLLEMGSDPNQYEIDGVGPPVWLSAAGGRQEALQLLLEYKGDSNLPYGGKSPLMMAIGGSHLDCAELLLKHGADINYAGDLLSVLDMALLHGQFDDVIWLFNHGYTHDLSMARRMIVAEKPRVGQESSKEKALEILDRLLVLKQKQ